MLNMSECTTYNKTLDMEIEMKLHLGNGIVKGIAMSLVEDYEIGDQLFLEEPYNTNNIGTSEDNITEESNETTDDANETASKGGEYYLPLHENRPKTISRGRRQMIEETLDDMEKADCVL